jgi:hypothetical protein
LRIDVSDVAPAASYRVTVVDESGQVVERAEPHPASGVLLVSLQHSLAPGQYWVRLSTPDLTARREYALRIR